MDGSGSNWKIQTWMLTGTPMASETVLQLYTINPSIFHPFPRIFHPSSSWEIPRKTTIFPNHPLLPVTGEGGEGSKGAPRHRGHPGHLAVPPHPRATNGFTASEKLNLSLLAFLWEIGR